MHSSKVVGARGSSGLGAAYPAPISVPGVTGGAAKGPSGYSSSTGAGYDAGKYYSSQSSSYYSQPSAAKPSAIPSYWSQPSTASSSSSSYSSYLSSGAAASSVPAYTSSYGSFVPSSGSTSRGRGTGSGYRGGGGFRGRGGINKPRANVIKPKPPPPMTPEQKQHAENHNIKQLVAPKPPFVILNEMVGGGVQYEYTENPPIPDFVGYLPQLHTLMTEIDGDISTGTGPRYEIAKNICAEHAIQGVVSRRYEGLKKLVESGTKTREELLLEDETPFELASIAIFKMMNDWQADGYEIPEPIQDVIYSRQGFIPAKQRLGWIRGSNMGFNAYQLDQQGRRKPITMPGNTEGKNPVAFLNEIRDKFKTLNMEYPKKKKTNNFINFVLSKRRDNDDWRDLSMPELVNVCGPLWTGLSKEDRSVYEDPNQERKVDRIRHGGYDSFGRPLEDVLNRESNEKEEIEKMRSGIRERITNTGRLESTPFFILHFNLFCVTDEGVPVPAEMAIARFTLKDGVSSIYHELLDPGVIPTGYRADCMEASKATHKIPLDLVHLNQNYHDIVNNLRKFLGVSSKSSSLPPLYCHPKHAENNRLCLDWLFKKAGGACPSYNFSQLPMLLFELVAARKTQYDVELPTVYMAEVQLDRDVFLYTPGMGCEWHEADTEVSCCASAVVRRWSYIISDLVCRRYNLPMLPGFHAPVPEEAGQVSRYESSDLYSTSDISDTGSVCSSTSDSEHPLQNWLQQKKPSSSSEPRKYDKYENGMDDNIRGLMANSNLDEDEDGFSECDSDALGFSNSSIGSLEDFSESDQEKGEDISESDREKVGFGGHQYEEDTTTDEETAEKPSAGINKKNVEKGVVKKNVYSSIIKKNKVGANRYDTDSTDCEGDQVKPVKKVGFGQSRYDSDSKDDTDTSGRNFTDTSSFKSAQSGVSSSQNSRAEILQRIRNNKGKKSNYLFSIAQKKTDLIEP